MAIDKRTTRLGTLALVGTLLFGLVGARLWFLQTVQQETLQEQVERTKERTAPLLPQRGRIFDADGRILADNERVLSVGLDWEVLADEDDRTEIFRRLSGWLDVPVEDMEAEFDRDVHSPLLPMPVATDVDEPTLSAIRERVEDFPGVQIIEGSRRIYPFAPLASHVIGYMGRITPETAETYTREKGYQPDERVGQFGIELSMEEELRGIPGYVKFEVDRAGRIIREIERVPAISGRDVQLTIDLDQQQYAEQALETQLKERRAATAPNPIDRETQRRLDPDRGAVVAFKAPAGAVVVQNHQTGHIVALASYPTFDNRWFEAGLSGDEFRTIFPSKNADGTDIDPDRSILVNRAIQGRYNLGSTFKPFTAYAALATGLIGVGEAYEDTGTYRMESIPQSKCDEGVRCVFKNAVCPLGEPCVYGTVDVELALAVSSDAFFYRIGELMMVRNDNKPILQEQVRLFGFGEDPGIKLPFAFDGAVPDKELKALYAELGAITDEEGLDYYTGDNVQLAIGQGLLSASPLHLAMGYSAIANGGSVLRPEIIKAVYEPGTPDAAVLGFADVAQARLAAVPNVSGDLIRQVPMSEEIRSEIDRGLRRVITGPGTSNGRSTTGQNLFATYPSEAIPIAGKTGTAQGAQNYPWNDSSVFAGYSLDPERPFTVSAYLEKSGYGGKAAGPVTKCIFTQLSGMTRIDPVVLADPLDTSNLVPAPARRLADSSCFDGRFDTANVRAD